MKTTRLTALLTTSILALASPAAAFDFSSFVPEFRDVFDARELFQHECGALSMWFGDPDQARCESLAAQIIEEDIEALRDSGTLIRDLEHMAGRTGDGATVRIQDVDGTLNERSTETHEHRRMRGWSAYDDIYSCEEYLYKRFQTVRDFGIDVEANANTPMVALENAFADDGGLGSILSDGAVLTGWGGATFDADQVPYSQADSPRVYRDRGSYVTAPRNDFFGLSDEELRAGAAHSRLTEGFLRDGREGTYTYANSGGWRIHEYRYAALRDTPASTLAYFRDRRLEFTRFLTERERARQHLLRYAPGVDTTLIRGVPRSTTPTATVAEAAGSLAECVAITEILDPALALDCPGLPPEDCEFFRGAAMREIEEGRSVYCSTEQQNLVHALMNDFELYNVQLGELLDGAEALGCTDGTVRWYSPIGPCDWSPEDFIHDVGSLTTVDGLPVAAKMEAERGRCLDYVTEPAQWGDLVWGDAEGASYRYFSDAAQVRDNDWVIARADGRLSPSDLHEFFGRAAQTDQLRLAAVAEFADEIADLPEHRRPRLQSTGSGGDRWSQDLGIPFVDDGDVVAAGYNYAYDVGLIDAEHVSGLRTARDGASFDPVADPFDADRPLCRPHPHVSAHFDAYVQGFGVDADVLNVNLDARVHQDERPDHVAYRAMLDVEVLGIDVVAPFDSEGSARSSYEWNITSGESERSARFMNSYIPIGGSFPVTLNVRGTGTVGAEWNVQAGTGLRTDEDGCLTAALTGNVEVTPFGSLSAKGRAGIGYPGLSGGAYVEVDLLRIDLPISGDLELDAYADGDGEVTIRGDVSLDVTSMSGSAGVYVEALFWDKKWGVDWAGTRLAEATLWSADYSYSFDFWRAVSCLVAECA